MWTRRATLVASFSRVPHRLADGSEHWIFAGRVPLHESGQPYDVRRGGGYHRAEARGSSLARKRREVAAGGRVPISVFRPRPRRQHLYWSPEMRISTAGAREPVTLPAYLKCVYPATARESPQASSARTTAGTVCSTWSIGLCSPTDLSAGPASGLRRFRPGGCCARPVRTVGAIRDITAKGRPRKSSGNWQHWCHEPRCHRYHDHGGRLVYLNQAAMTLFGLASIEEACLRTLFDLVAESDREQARADLGAA